MKKELLILTDRSRIKQPAMSCVVEMENAISRSFEGQIIDNTDSLPKDLSRVCLLFTCLSFGGIDPDTLADLKQRGCTVIVYVFDGWSADTFFYSKRRRVKAFLRPAYQLSNFCDRICGPFPETKAEFSEGDRSIVRYVPLAVDTSLVAGLNSQRPITVLGYGRQPSDLTKVLSESLNRPSDDGFFHHTDHMGISRINDFGIHRRHFWKMAQNSLFAIAYDQLATPREQFRYSIVGQRWFECLSAGCVVVGRRPTASDTEELIGWQDATIEAPDDPQHMVGFLNDLIASPGRIAEIRERNVEQMKARHDWTHRFSDIVAAEGL